jgi:hypothetical protein
LITVEFARKVLVVKNVFWNNMEMVEVEMFCVTVVHAKAIAENIVVGQSSAIVDLTAEQLH